MDQHRKGECGASQPQASHGTDSSACVTASTSFAVPLSVSSLDRTFLGDQPMATASPTETTKITRETLIDKLNEDLAREYQAIIAYVVYSQVLKGAEYM